MEFSLPDSLRSSARARESSGRAIRPEIFAFKASIAPSRLFSASRRPDASELRRAISAPNSAVSLFFLWSFSSNCARCPAAARTSSVCEAARARPPESSSMAFLSCSVSARSRRSRSTLLPSSFSRCMTLEEACSRPDFAFERSVSERVSASWASFTACQR